MELRPTPAGQVGLFPEHAPVARWAAAEAEAIQHALGRPATVLNLFAYTGLASLVLARAGARVAHVDASRPAVAWARRNAALAGLADRPIRWLVEDATRFVAREARRGRLYDGVVLDPPTYGHGPGGGAWRLADDLEPLVRQIAPLLAPERWFLACTAHATALEPDDLAGIVGAALGWAAGTPRVMELGLEAESGARLAAGWAALAMSGRREAHAVTPRPHAADVITSAANPRVRAALALRERRGRDEAGRLLVDGTREVLRALEAGLVVREAFVVDGARSQEAAAVAGAAGCPRRSAGGRGRLGVVAARLRGARQRDRRGRRRAADRPRPPRDDPGRPPGPAAHRGRGRGEAGQPRRHRPERGRRRRDGAPGGCSRRAARGSVEPERRAGEPGHRVQPADRDCPDADAPALAAASARSAWWRPGCRPPRTTARWTCEALVAIVVGSEAAGLSRDWLADEVEGVRLPMLGRADSLNVSAAAAVLLYEARRQRDGVGPAEP